MQLRFCRWQTWKRAPYFANLKVMRSTLNALREELVPTGGVLQAYVFLEEELTFLVEGNPETLPEALERARTASEVRFRAADRKPLWGETGGEAVSDADRDRLLDSLRRLPEQAGLASDVSEYPWAGGDWLVPTR